MKRILLMICLAAVVMGAQAENKYREFTSAEGKTIRGCIKAYDAANEIVTIERDSRKTAKVPITVFSEDDQNYIRDWEIVRIFTKDRYFKISANRRKDKNERMSFSSTTREVDVLDTSYEILLENCSSSELKGLELEYGIYYEQGQEGIYYDKLDIDSIPPNSNKMHSTESVSTYKSELGGGYYYISGADNTHSGEVNGIWIRVHLKSSSGQKLTREYCLPDSLDNSRKWATTSIDVGMNKEE